MKAIKIITFFTLALVAFPWVNSMAQTKGDSDLVQFTGFVVNYDSTKTIPFVTIRIQGTSRGTYSDMQGYFSFVAKRSDVLVFSYLGYKTRFYALKSNSKNNKIMSVVSMIEDTFQMEEIVIIGRPTAEQLDYMFSRTRLPDDDLRLAQQNLRRKPLSEMSENLSYDAYDNARWNFNSYADKAYYNGQPQPIPVLDVFAWSKFIKALEKGDLKRK